MAVVVSCWAMSDRSIMVAWSVVRTVRSVRTIGTMLVVMVVFVFVTAFMASLPARFGFRLSQNKLKCQEDDESEDEKLDVHDDCLTRTG